MVALEELSKEKVSTLKKLQRVSKGIEIKLMGQVETFEKQLSNH
jgi:hypothetical protein